MKCKFLKGNGEGCKAHPISGSEYCYYHNPAIKASDKHKSRARGGKMNKHTNSDQRKTSSLKLKEMADVVKLLEDIINTIRAELYTTDSLTAKIKIANSLGFLSGHLLNALEKSDLEKRLEELEQRLFEKDTHK